MQPCFFCFRGMYGDIHLLLPTPTVCVCLHCPLMDKQYDLTALVKHHMILATYSRKSAGSLHRALVLGACLNLISWSLSDLQAMNQRTACLHWQAVGE